MKTSKKRIGLVLSKPPGYSETFLNNKVIGLQESGFEVIVFVEYKLKSNQWTFPVFLISPSNSGFFEKLIFVVKSIILSLVNHPIRSYKHYKLDKKDNKSVIRSLKNIILNQKLLGARIDWLHFGFGMLTMNRENVAQAIGAKMGVSFRGADLYLTPIKHPNCYNNLFQKKINYHVLAKEMKNTLIEIYKVNPKKISVITPAIDSVFFKRRKTSINSIKIKLVTVARLHWKKGLDYTLEALRILKDMGVDFEYTIVGEGDQYERLVFAAYQLDLQDNVQFVGKLSPEYVKNVLEESDIYIQYSIQEGFCNAVLEAQAMELLCVVSDAEGLPENVLDGETGWVVPQRNPIALANKLHEVIGLSAVQKEEIRTSAANRVRESFDLDQQKKAFALFFKGKNES